MEFSVQDDGISMFKVAKYLDIYCTIITATIGWLTVNQCSQNNFNLKLIQALLIIVIIINIGDAMMFGTLKYLTH